MNKSTHWDDFIAGIFLGEIIFLIFIVAIYGRNNMGKTLVGILFGELLLLVMGGFIAFVVRSIREHKELRLLKKEDV